jgi:hypothetical protein
MPYCGNCGSENIPNAKFCGNCGAKFTIEPQAPQQQNQVLPPPPPPPPPPTQEPTPIQAPPNMQFQQDTSERIIGVLPLRHPKSFGRFDFYAGVVTSTRMIFAQVTDEMVKQSVSAARDQAKAEGKGFFGQWASQLANSFGYTKRYLSMAPATILAETAGNFAYDNGSIYEVKVKHKEIRDSDGMVHHSEFEIEVKTNTGTVEFKMEEDTSYTDLLKSVYGDRVKMPFGYFSKTINIKF